MSTSGFFRTSDWYDDDAPVLEPQQQQRCSKRIHPWEEWHDAPKQTVKQLKVSAAAPAKQPLGKYHEVAQQVAKAVLDGDNDIALQLARVHWAGDPEVAGLR